ncbi:MAG: chemotaxis protein CheW [Oscillospiraceae bacterium]
MAAENILNDELASENLQGKILTFNIGEQRYGIEILYTIEIIGLQHITVVPGVPAETKGILNSRGKVIPVIDVSAKFGKVPKPYDDRTSIIIIQVSDLTIGLIVESIEEVITITEEHLSSVPDFKQINSNKYVKYLANVNNQINIVLDCEQLFDDHINKTAL